jgi:FkbM family methyltransferase
MDCERGDASRMGVLQWRFDVERGDDQFRLHSGWRPKNLRTFGFSPATIIDVGVAHGTPSFYAAFPDAYRVLIEPLVEWEANLVRWTDEVRGEYHLTAVGARAGTITINLCPECLQMSSVYEFGRDWRPPGGTEEREVPLTTLDQLLEERSWRPPYGLKLDTEGTEYEVAEGATKLLEQTQFVIAELMIARHYESPHSFADFVGLMDARGFAFTDALDGKKRGSEVVYLDVLFSRRSNDSLG